MKTNGKMTKKSTILKCLGFFVLSALFLVSCNDDRLISGSGAKGETDKLLSTHRIITGDSILLENPYNVAQMQKALDQIRNDNPNSEFKDLSSFVIKPTHLYIMFKPNSDEEVGLLKQDSARTYFDYRLDCLYADRYLENRGANTLDSITKYYTAVKQADISKLPDVRYEILDELYIPEQENYFSDVLDVRDYLLNGVVNNKTDFFNHLLYYAFKNTNNERDFVDYENTAGKWIFGTKWWPSGNINVTDECTRRSPPYSSTVIPLEGAKVLIRQWFTVESGITDANGHFQTGSVRGKANYVLQWERYQYSIRSGLFGQAETHGPSNVKQYAWNITFNGGLSKYYSHIHRAAFHYYYKNIKNLRRPPENGFWNTQMKIGAMDQSSGTNGDYSCFRGFLGILPSIRIYNPSRSACNIYATTIHELAHASHSKMGGRITFMGTDDKVVESWARGVEWDLTRMTYNNYNAIAGRPKYTLVVQDMLDNDGFYGLDGISGDNVNGYNIRQIEDALNGKKTWVNWRDNIKNMYPNPTENHLDNLFNYWN